ncbi:MAG: energy-coupling factor ABC transporter permease, partial [Campylobacterota bacterium]|nr:energy-coupling factor ABC transporter permease [Campylobacterota bacterium]
ILGSTIFLLFGAAPAAFGLAFGLLIQGILFAQFDLPQYGINVTTLLMPLFVMSYLAKKIIPKNIAYKDIAYKDALKLSLAYQGGIVAWVAFWALFGQGFGAENLAAVSSFGVAYMSVVILEPFIDLAVLAGAKTLKSLEDTPFVNKRVYNPLKA